MNTGRCLLSLALGGCVCAAWAAPVRHNYDLKNVLWRLSFSLSNGTIAGDATNTLMLLEDSPTVELSCSELDVHRVMVDGTPAKFQAKNDVLSVTLPHPGKKGQTIAVRAIYSGAPVNGLYFVPDSRAFPSKTGMIYTQGEGEDNHFWLPTYDLPDDKATTEAFITAPRDWTAISNGKLVGVANVPEGRVFHWKMAQPYSTYLISLVAGRYTKVHDQWHGIPVDFYVPPGLEKEGRESFGETPKMIDVYSKLTGVNYPYPQFAQDVVADFMNGGMENMTSVTQTIRTLHGAGTEPITGSTGLVAHELAHQWFGDLITLKTWEHMWLNEGFATALPTFYDRATKGQDAFDLDRYGAFEGAIDSIGSRGRGPVAGAVGSVERVSMGSPYPGGASRILMLMHHLGEDRFWKGIHNFLETYKFKNATTSEFFEAVSKSSGVDLSAFQKQWFHTAATPSLTAEVVGNELVVSQLEPYYTLDLPVWILNGSNWVKKQVHLDGPQAKLDLGDLAGKPLLVDPQVWTAMELKYKISYSGPEVNALYRHSPNAAAKARIIAEFFDSIPASWRVSIARTEKFAGLLQAMAPKIGADGQAFLLELTKHANKRIAYSAVIALGALPTTEDAKIRLAQIANSDPNEVLREQATQALLNWSSDPELARRTWTKHAFDDGYRLAALEWWGGHDAPFARQKALDILAHPDSEPLRVAAIKLLGRVKEASGDHAVFDALVAVAKETSFWARMAAINSLGQLGNKDAIAVIEPITTHGPGGIRGTARAVVEQLKKAG